MNIKTKLLSAIVLSTALSGNIDYFPKKEVEPDPEYTLQVPLNRDDVAQIINEVLQQRNIIVLSREDMCKLNYLLRQVIAYK